MNVQLRKRHRVMWLVIGIGLPLLCLQAIESIPVMPTAGIPRISCPANITECGIGERHEAADHTVTVALSNQDSTATLKISYTQPLVSAFTLAYLSSGEEVNDNSKLIGSLDKMGEYNFQMSQKSMTGMTHLVIYDKLKGNTLYHQNLNELNR